MTQQYCTPDGDEAVIKKLAIVTECDECPNVWMYLGTTHCCQLMDKRRCYNDLENDPDIPVWCPLPDTSKE